MNKAFVREPDRQIERCPRCGSQGEPVGQATLRTYLRAGDVGKLSATANFCPAPQCPVAYFDVFERVVMADQLTRGAYPKDPHAPICGCFGLTTNDIDRDIEEGTVERTKAAIQKAQSPAARCSELAANGRNCVAHVQKYFIRMKGERTGG